jgi:hypothetical protein
MYKSQLQNKLLLKINVKQNSIFLKHIIAHKNISEVNIFET